MKSRPVNLKPPGQRTRMRYLVLQVWLNYAEHVLRISAFYARMLASEGLLLLASDLGVGEKDLATIRRRAYYESNFITELLPQLGKWFDRALVDGAIHPFEQFASAGCYPRFLGDLFAKVFDGISGDIKVDADATAVQIIRQVCFYAYKVDLPYAPEKVETVINSFVSTELEVKSFNEDDSPRSEVFDAFSAIPAAVVSRLFKGFSLKGFHPKHGPGISADAKITEKWSKRISVGSPKSMSSAYFFNETAALDQLEKYPVWKHTSYFGQDNPPAKVILVPKDSRGPRLISAEPVHHQFMQQGLKDLLVEWIESSPLTKGHVNFTDQSVNRDLALSSSRTGEWATIDLKDASDRVSLRLVKRLFGGTGILDFLLDMRTSSTTLPSGEVISLHKYAPMGSALCFPVLATCVWAISVASLLAAGYSMESACASVYVYGDDLIAPASASSGIFAALELCGLKVNKDKSFVGARFAESCGMDAFDGVCVTPVRLRSSYSVITGQGASQVTGLVRLLAHARELDEKGYKQSAEYYYSLVEEVLGPLPYLPDTSQFLGRYCDQDSWATLFGEWNERCNKGRKSFKAFFVEPETGSNKDDLWDHLYRTHRVWGSGEAPVKLGRYDLPRKVRLIDRRTGGNSFRLGVYSVPEWVS